MKAARSGGFTLIELMITVAIVGILAAVAYPSYVEHVRKSRRADCKAVMLSYANALERAYSLNNTYPNAALAGFACPPDGGTATYTLNLVGGASFTLTATPTGAQAGDSCGTLTLTNTGARSASGTGTCW